MSSNTPRHSVPLQLPRKSNFIAADELVAEAEPCLISVDTRQMEEKTHLVGTYTPIPNSAYKIYYPIMIKSSRT